MELDLLLFDFFNVDTQEFRSYKIHAPTAHLIYKHVMS